jgi:hypothetical protein
MNFFSGLGWPENSDQVLFLHRSHTVSFFFLQKKHLVRIWIMSFHVKTGTIMIDYVKYFLFFIFLKRLENLSSSSKPHRIWIFKERSTFHVYREISNKLKNYPYSLEMITETLKGVLFEYMSSWVRNIWPTRQIWYLNPLLVTFSLMALEIASSEMPKSLKSFSSAPCCAYKWCQLFGH